MAHQFKKQYGQNFLRYSKYANNLISALDINDQDLIIEIGPGNGALTFILIEKAAHVVAIEIDTDLVDPLTEKFTGSGKFDLINQDVMRVDFDKLIQVNFPRFKSVKIIGALPYNISKQIISKLLNLPTRVAAMGFIIQTEVADEYLAKAPKATFLSNWLGLFAEIKKVETIPADYFFPKPKVNGTSIVITPKADMLNAAEMAKMSTLIRQGFAQPRKTLLNNLSALDTSRLKSEWNVLKLSPTIRPAELTPTQWQEIAGLIDLSVAN